MNNRYHKDLDQSTVKFLNALAEFQVGPVEQRDHHKGVMERELLLIRAAVAELKRPGVHKQDVLVENNYKAYIADANMTNYAALKHDIETLRLYNELP